MLEKTISAIRQRFDMNQQEKTNRRLAILTILSAIFMPLTFIAGIYGMNFDKMPELHFPYSYLIDNFNVSVGQVVTQWYGQADPVASNDTSEGRQQNRRVEAIVMGFD